MDKKFGVFVFLIGLFVVSLFVREDTKSASVWTGGGGLSVYYFYGEGCPHCAKVAPFIAEMEQKYPLRVYRFDVYNNRSCLSLFDEYSDMYGLPLERRAVPTVFVSGTYLVGDTPIIEGFEEAVKKALMKNSSTGRPSEVEVPESSGEQLKPVASNFSILTFVVAALVDSINPCSIAILVFLIGARVLVSNRRKRALNVGLAFCLSVFIGYFLFGLGLFTFVQFSGFAGVFSLLVGLIAVLAGFFCLKDALWRGRGGFVMEVPRSLKPLLMKLLKGVTSPFGAFAMGFVVVCFELPCSGGPYLFILGQLANSTTRLQAIPLLLFYNFVFVLPLILISLLLYSNLFSLGRIREWNEGNKRLLRLIGGLTMMGLGFLVIPASQVFQMIQLFLRCFRVVGLPLLAIMFLYFFVSFANRKNLGSKLTGRVGRTIPLVSLCVAALFAVPTPSYSQGDGASYQILDMKLGWPLLPVIGDYPFYAARCPEKQTAVWGTADHVWYVPPHYSTSMTDRFVVYGKYKDELVWNRLVSWEPPSSESTCDNDAGCPGYADDLPWVFDFPLPKPSEEESSGVFQIWVLARGCVTGTCDPPYVSPEGVAKNFQTQAQTEFGVFAIKEIKIEPDNPETTRLVTYTAELPSDLGAFSSLTPEVSWEVEPFGSRKTMSPEGGGKPLKKWTGEGNPWRDTPEIDTHGEKKVKVKVTWGEEYCKAEKEKKYKLFFVKNGDDYPGSPGPNWFSYWSSHDDRAVTTKGFTHTIPTTNSMYGGHGAGPSDYGRTNPGTGVTYIFDPSSLAYVDNLAACGININKEGIDTLAFIIGHERCHADVWNNWRGGPWQGLADSDCDGIPDTVETATNACLKPNTTDSFNGNYSWAPTPSSSNPWGRDGKPGGGDDGTCARVNSVDEEIYCDIRGLADAVSNAKKDWANPGKQSRPPGCKRLIVENGTSATLTGKFAEYGKDTDGNGLFNFLTIEAEINVISAGTYSLLGLLSKNQNVFSASNDTFYFDVGLHNFTLNFDGITFRKQRIDGPFNLESISLFLSTNGSDSRTNVLNTSAYSYKQFEQPKAELVGSFSESAIDTNGNSLFDRLDISVAVNVTEAGYYTIIGDLKNEGILVSSTNSSYLNTGEQDVILSFDGMAIRSYRANGPYSLKVVEVQDQDYNRTDAIQDAYNTSAYLYTQFERPKAEFTGKFNDFGVDTDTNGLFNILKIEAEVDAEEAGNYTFSVDLADISDNGITHNYTYVWLNPGTQNITIDLNGTAIGDHGVNGPYVLTSLALYESGGFPLSVEVDYHNTLAYSYSQFESSGITENVHDIAVTNITPSTTLVYPGDTIPIDVTIENQGNYTETFNVTVYANTTIIQTQVVILESGGSETITLTWDTTGFAEGNYTISAQAWPVLATDEPDTPDNTLTDGTIIVIPEFPSTKIIAIFMTATLSVAIIYKRKRFTMRTRNFKAT